MTDIASYFRWTPLAGCSRYEIQIARDAAFTDIYRMTNTENVRYHEDSYFPRVILPTGSFYWRVRAIINGRDGPWSETFAVTINADHALAKKVVRDISPDRPVFLMRNFGLDPRQQGSAIKTLFPPNVQGIIIPDDTHLWDASQEAMERAQAYEARGIDFVIWNNRARAPLSLLEYCFQHFHHCIGTAEGEHFWSYGWERGPEGNISEWDYVSRAWTLCAKYGRLYFISDGEAFTYLWTVVSHDYEAKLKLYHSNVVPMFKSTVGNVGLHSLGATQGLMASGWVDNCGYWADEFVWDEAGFGKLGEKAEGRHFAQGTALCPFAFDVQMWLMGIASGATAFHVESAHQWTDQGTGADNYNRLFLPFIQAVMEHHLLPSRSAYLDSLKVAVACDYEAAKKKHANRYEPDFAFLTDLYALQDTPFQEVIPNQSRYGIICLLPPGATCLNRQTHVVAQAQLLPPGAAREVFDQAYPALWHGDAFQWVCDESVIVTNANENVDKDQTFSIPLATGLVRHLAGVVGLHQYLIGKTEKGGFWFQANGEYPDRPIKITLTCDHAPQITVKPITALLAQGWDADRRQVTLTLQLHDGPAECTVRRLE